MQGNRRNHKEICNQTQNSNCHLRPSFNLEGLETPQIETSQLICYANITINT